MRTGRPVAALVGLCGRLSSSPKSRRANDVPPKLKSASSAVFGAIDALPTFQVPADFPEPAELVRQMREERDDQIVPELRHIR